MRGVRAICYVTLFLELCGCRGCAKPQRRVEAADPWPPSSECYSRKQHISHPQRWAFPPARRTHNPLQTSGPEPGTDQGCLLNLAQGCFTCQAYTVRWPNPALIVFGKHSITGRPLTLCLGLFSVSTATKHCHLLWWFCRLLTENSQSTRFSNSGVFFKDDWFGDIFTSEWRKDFTACQWVMYVHSSLSVCSLLDNRSAVVCVLRSLADLCSVLPPCSGLAASQSPNILYSNHTFPMSHTDKRLNISTFSDLYLSLHLLPLSLIPVLGQQSTACAAGIIMFAYIPPTYLA